MKIAENVYLVGSGLLGWNRTNDYDCNVYLLDGGNTRMLIDSGAGINAPAILSTIEHCGFDPATIEYLFITHGHADHSGGAHEIQMTTGARIICSKATSRMLRAGDEDAIGLVEARKSGIYPGDYTFKPCEPAFEVYEGFKLQIGEISVHFIEAPGHSHDMMCAYIPSRQFLFSSDTLFEDGRIAKLASPDFSLAALSSSIRKFESLPIAGLFPGHLSPVTAGAAEIVKTANERFAQGILPESIV